MIETGTVLAQAIFDLDKLSSVDNPFEILTVPALIIAYMLCLLGLIFGLIKGIDTGEIPQKSIILVSIIIVIIAAKPLIWSTSMEIAYYVPDMMIERAKAQGDNTGLLSASNRLRIMAAQMASKQNTFSDHLEKYTLDESNPDSVINYIRLPESEKSFASELKAMYHFTGSLFAAAGDKFSSWAIRFAAEVVNLVAWVGAILQVPAYIMQYCLAYLAGATLPIGLALLTIPALSSIGKTYIGMCVSVLLWPLGFLIVNIITDVSIDLCVAVTPAKGMANYMYLIMPVVPASLLITGTFMVPMFCYSLCTQGGSGMIPSAGIGAMIGARGAMGVAEKAMGPVGALSGAGRAAASRAIKPGR